MAINHVKPTSDSKLDKWALITGASSGIGEATAKQLAQSGYHLILVARRKERLEKLQKSLEESAKIQVLIAVVDVSKSEQVKAFVEKFKQPLAQLSVLVNNAGLAKGAASFQEGDTADWDVMIDTNVKGVLYFTRAVLPFLIAKKSGHIVNMGSVAGRWVYPGGAVYCATKFAVRAVSESLRMDLLGQNIRVTDIEPGMVETEFSLVRHGDAAKARQVYAGMKPLTAEDIADTIAWVVTRPAHVNIQELVIYPTDQASVRDTFRV
ncbi:MAG: SDR family NAD(P)-dependent oxidoreductase [Pseudobdellovibrionaceae bacterium]